MPVINLGRIVFLSGMPYTVFGIDRALGVPADKTLVKWAKKSYHKYTRGKSKIYKGELLVDMTAGRKGFIFRAEQTIKPARALEINNNLWRLFYFHPYQLFPLRLTSRDVGYIIQDIAEFASVRREIDDTYRLTPVELNQLIQAVHTRHKHVINWITRGEEPQAPKQVLLTYPRENDSIPHYKFELWDIIVYIDARHITSSRQIKIYSVDNHIYIRLL